MADKKQPKYGVWRNLTKEELREIEEKKMANAEKPVIINTDFKSALRKIARTRVKR
jgi:hypothetical protein